MVINAEKLSEALNNERESKVKLKLSFLGVVVAGMKPAEAANYFGISVATAYKWIRCWNAEGIEGLRPKKIPGRPPRLSKEKLDELRGMLKAKPYWSIKEVIRLVEKLFGVNYSDDQIRRILVDKLGMNYAKPFVRDKRRPKDAEGILADRMGEAIKNLKDKGYRYEDIVIGFLDETSPQNRANTARVLSFGKPKIFKNMDKMKVNTMGYYSVNGRSVISFPGDSRWESIISFIRKVKKNNPDKAVIIVLDNLKSHKVAKVKAEAERLGIELVFLPPYSPDLNPIEYIWKSIKRAISVTLVRHIDDMRNAIKEAFYRLSKRLTFANAWLSRFLCPNYTYFCK